MPRCFLIITGDFHVIIGTVFGAKADLVLCLYCETELKPFRGFFDEDFCCRDHREKYFSSVRKALTDFGVAEQRAQPRLKSAPDPRVADFLPITISPSTAGVSQHGWEPEVLSVRHEVEFPSREIAWSAALGTEERPADLAVPLEHAVAALEPGSSPLDVAGPGLTAELQATKPFFETAGPVLENGAASGFHAHWNYAEPLFPAPVQFSVPLFAASAETAGLPLCEGFAECTLFCEEPASAPVASSEIAVPQETSIPAFTPAGETIPGEDEHDPETGPAEPYWGELYTDPAPASNEYGSALALAPEIVPVMVLSSASHDRPVLVPSPSSEMMPHNLELAPARPLNVPAVAPQPGIAAELAPAIADSDAADSAEPHSHEPMRLTFGNLVRIKSWRLRITFAKPA